MPDHVSCIGFLDDSKKAGRSHDVDGGDDALLKTEDCDLEMLDVEIALRKYWEIRESVAIVKDDGKRSQYDAVDDDHPLHGC